MRRADIKELNDGLRGILAKVETGGLTLSVPSRYRIEGAIVALAAVLGEISDIRRELGIDS